MSAQGRQRELLADDQRRHAGAPVPVRHGHAIDRGLDHARRARQGFGDLRGGDVLPQPAEGVAHPVDEEEEARRVPPHQVAGAEPAVARREDVAQHFGVAVGGVRVAVEAARARGAPDEPDRFPHLVRRGAQAEPLRGSQRHAGFGGNADDGGGKPMGQEGGDATNRAGLSLDVHEGEAAFRRGVELQDLRQGEAVAEPLPDIGAQAVAKAEAQAVRWRFALRRGCGEQVAAELADILEQRAVPARHVVPEPRCREAIRDHHRSPGGQHAARCHDAADAVEQRQAVIHPVVRPEVGESREPAAPGHDAPVADHGCLGQPGGAGGVDQQGAVGGPRRSALLRAERLARQRRQETVEGRLVAHPHLWLRGEVGQGADEPVRQRGRHDHVGGPGHRDAMGERGPHEARVQQRRRQADAG